MSRGHLERGLFRKVDFLEILENLEILEILENPQTVETKENPTINFSRHSRDLRNARGSRVARRRAHILRLDVACGQQHFQTLMTPRH